MEPVGGVYMSKLRHVPTKQSPQYAVLFAEQRVYITQVLVLYTGSLAGFYIFLLAVSEESVGVLIPALLKKLKSRNSVRAV
jgi:hypothetical protein